VGVDVVTLGLTKCGALLAEAVVLLRPGLADGLPYARKQAMQLASKGRFLGAQVTAMLEDGRWLQLAGHANAMAALLAQRLTGAVELAHPVETNAVFVRVDEHAAAALEGVGALHSWSPGIVRWMTAWDTTADEVVAFATRVRAALER
jgi:threonine aldolase